MVSPEARAKRTFRPSSRNLKPTLVGLSDLGSSKATLETWIAASRSMIPPASARPGFVGRLMTFTPATTTRCSVGRTRSTSPTLPLLRPAMTFTRSPFLILSLLAMVLQDLRRKRDDLHELLGAQLASHRSEDAGADRLGLLADEDRGVAVEADGAAVGAAQRERRAHDDGTMHLALLDAAARNRLLDGDDDDIDDTGILAARATQHLDALNPTGARIVGDLEIGSHLDHDCCSVPLGLGALDQNFPALGLGQGAALADAHVRADLALEGIGLVVRVILLRPTDELLVDRMLNAPFDLDDDGLVHLVADDDAFQNSLRHILLLTRRPSRPAPS